MTKTPWIRYVLVLSIASVAPACEREDTPRATETAAAAATVKQLQPWETFNEAFNGCAGGCGMRLAGPTEGVVAQPGVMVGQHTYCPVSGVAFEVKTASAHRTIGDKTLYFCCESCAAYFTANQAAVLAARGIAA